MNELFVPKELESIEVDVKSKTFKINGKDFGGGCSGFTITCRPDTWEVRMEVDTTVTFLSFDKEGMQKENRTYKTDTPWFGNADKLKNGPGDLEKRVADLESQSRQQKPTPLSQMKAALREALQSPSRQN